jgi:hypothetical protein
LKRVTEKLGAILRFPKRLEIDRAKANFRTAPMPIIATACWMELMGLDRPNAAEFAIPRICAESSGSRSIKTASSCTSQLRRARRPSSWVAVGDKAGTLARPRKACFRVLLRRSCLFKVAEDIGYLSISHGIPDISGNFLGESVGLPGTILLPGMG